jgi:hypothetical protein
MVSRSRLGVDTDPATKAGSGIAAYWSATATGASDRWPTATANASDRAANTAGTNAA